MATPDDPASPSHRGSTAAGDAWARLRRGPDASPSQALEPLPAVEPPSPPEPAPRQAAGRPTGRRIVVLLVLWLAAVSTGVLAGGIVAASQYKPVHGYRSTEVLLFDAVPEVVAARDSGVLAKLSALRIKYAGLVRTYAFATAVAGLTGVPAADVGSHVVAVAPPSSFLLDIVATTPHRQPAQQLARAAGAALLRRAVAEQQLAKVPPGLRYSVRVVTPATAAAKPSTRWKRPALYGVIAFVVVTALVLTVELYLSRRRRV